MNLRNLSGHTVDLDLLPERPRVLDVGCRGFDFCSDILAIRPKARIWGLDPDPEIKRPEGLSALIEFLNVALVHDERKESGYASYSTGEGNILTDLPSYYDAKMLTVSCVRMGELMLQLHVSHWDLVKLDCEGSEFDILANWPGPIADQISVEFHDGHPELKGEHRYKRDFYFTDLWNTLKDYKVIQHELFKQGYWFGQCYSMLVL